jgi:hypothetical protein
VKRPQTNTLANVVRYLYSIGLEVSGPCIDFDTGERIGDRLSYDSKRVLKYRKLHEKKHFPGEDDE